MRVFIKIIELISALAAMIASLLIGVAILIVCQMVFLRYVLVESTAWQTEVVTFSLVASTLLGSAWVLKERGHVAVEIISNYAPVAAKRLMMIFSDFIVFVFAAIMFWKGAELTWQAWEGSWTTDSIYEFPLWIPYISIPIGFLILALQAIACALKGATGLDDAPASGGH